MLHRTRDLLVRQRTMLVNALRGHMAELGVIAPQGISRVSDLVAVLLEEGETTMPTLARQALRGLAAELETLGQRIETIEASILAWHKGNEVSCRLATIPGIEPITPRRSWPESLILRSSTPAGTSPPGSGWCRDRTRVVASNGRAASPSRETAPCAGCWCLGATAVIRHARTRSAAEASWLRGLLERRPAKLVAVAQATRQRALSGPC
jgi:transposase